VVLVAIVGGALVLVALWFVVGDPDAEVAEPSATAIPSSSSATDDRISAIVADAHSGRYFSNDFEDTYPEDQERGVVRGMMKTMERVGPAATDTALACMLSYFETERSFTDLVRGTRTDETPRAQSGNGLRQVLRVTADRHRAARLRRRAQVL
jgi:hypothetical protein